jgi:hypothetical protein
VAPQVVAGVGIGCTFAPLITIAMRNISPMMAGAASAVFNTTRQVGTVIGTAGVGALLQNRLIAGFTSQVHHRAANLPAAAQQAILAKFQAAAKSGLAGGPTQRSSPLEAQIFTHGFVEGMRPTMTVPIVFLFGAAALCLLIKRRRKQEAASTEAASHETTPAAAG